jgi:alpha-L-fucosidase
VFFWLVPVLAVSKLAGMKSIHFFSLAVVGGALLAGPAGASAATFDPSVPETAAQRDARMKWFREARFGMFIHWGLYAVPAGEYKGNKNYAEWFLEETKMPVSEYEKFVPQFNPVQFNAKDWVRMAKEAGMKYIVITSKHHDGFGMFRSEQTDWCIKSTPFQRDPLKELAEACQAANLKLCFYHSIMDWHHPDWGTRRKWNDKVPATPPIMDRYTEYMKRQLKELLTGYGPIGIAWFDGEWESPWTHERGVDLYNYVRSLQPDIIVNNRVGKGRSGMQGMDKGRGVGDYGTPEQEIPPTGFGPGVDWESCMTMNNHWGYNKNDQNWKSAKTLVRNLVDCASKGGNYLLNIGPTAEGTFPPASIERLAAIGQWMKVNSEAIYDTTASPFKKLDFGRCTQKPGKLYLHVYDWPKGGLLGVPIANTVKKAYLLAKPDEALGVVAKEGGGVDAGVSIRVPAQAPDDIATVVALEIEGAPQVVVTTPNPYQDETKEQRDARMKWWREARFGMFIHWGVYSVPAGTFRGKQIGGIGEWIMFNAKIPVAEYRDFAKQFNPFQYDAEEWVKLAKEAGMKYIVITSKHHDGFTLFDSKASDWNVVKASSYGKDLLKPLAEACRKHGLKLGFYYSQAQDWNNKGGGVCGSHWDTAQDGNMNDYIRKVAVPQVKEILSNYGPISVLWWDTPCGITKEMADQLIPLLRLQPGIIHNNRLGGGYQGDSETPEQEIPATGFPGGRDWETCMTMNDTWGFKSYDNNWKPVEMLIRNLVDIASKGGNYLLNVGPTSEGLIPAPSVERLKKVGEWMKVNGEAVYATSASPFKRLPWGRCTKKLTADGATLYLHVFNWPADGKLLVPGLKNTVTGARLLADGSALNAEAGPDGVTLTVPANAPDKISSTIVLQLKGEPVIEAAVLAQAADGTVSLAATEAVCHGGQIKFEGGAERDCIGFWLDPNDWVEWQFKATKPGRYVLTAEIAATGSGSFEVSLGNQKIKATAPNTGNYGKFQKVELGTLELTATGKVSLAVKAVKDGWQPFNLRSIKFKPAP